MEIGRSDSEIETGRVNFVEDINKRIGWLEKQLPTALISIPGKSIFKRFLAMATPSSNNADSITLNSLNSNSDSESKSNVRLMESETPPATSCLDAKSKGYCRCPALDGALARHFCKASCSEVINTVCNVNMKPFSNLGVTNHHTNALKNSRGKSTAAGFDAIQSASSWFSRNKSSSEPIEIGPPESLSGRIWGGGFPLFLIAGLIMCYLGTRGERMDSAILARPMLAVQTCPDAQNLQTSALTGDINVESPEGGAVMTNNNGLLGPKE